MLCVVLDCISSVNDVLVYLIYYLFVYLWAVVQIHSYSTGFSPVVRHEKYPIYCAQIYKSMLCVVLDCISSVNDVLVYLIYYLFVYLWAFIQIHSYSTGFSPVVRHEKYPIYCAQIYKSMLCVVLDCISSVNDVLVYLIYYLFVYLWAVVQIHSYSTWFSPVVRHKKISYILRSDLQIDVVRSIRLHI